MRRARTQHVGWRWHGCIVLGRDRENHTLTFFLAAGGSIDLCMWLVVLLRQEGGSINVGLGGFRGRLSSVGMDKPVQELIRLGVGYETPSLYPHFPSNRILI